MPIRTVSLNAAEADMGRIMDVAEGALHREKAKDRGPEIRTHVRVRSSGLAPRGARTTYRATVEFIERRQEGTAEKCSGASKRVGISEWATVSGSSRRSLSRPARYASRTSR